MNLLIIGITFGIIGKILLGIAVFRVHTHIQKTALDTFIPRVFKHEHYLTIIGLVFILIGFVCEILFYNQFIHIFK
jgi:flagellar biosynthesis protein FliQ